MIYTILTFIYQILIAMKNSIIILYKLYYFSSVKNAF